MRHKIPIIIIFTRLYSIGTRLVKLKYPTNSMTLNRIETKNGKPYIVSKILN
jgi:hypothetical protein